MLSHDGTLPKKPEQRVEAKPGGPFFNKIRGVFSSWLNGFVSKIQ